MIKHSLVLRLMMPLALMAALVAGAGSVRALGQLLTLRDEPEIESHAPVAVPHPR
jgi:hypothetical protein